MNPGHQRTLRIRVPRVQVYQALTEKISEWWSSDFQGQSAGIGDEFTVRFGDTFKTMRISDVAVSHRIAWLCVAQRIVMPAGMLPLQNDSEWVGQTIRWTLHPDGAGTLLTFLHEGLTPEAECWSVCEPGWDQTLQSLSLLLETGTGRPFASLDQEHLAQVKTVQRLR